MSFQVAGELSNAGQPMRRFMQTFILAPQSPKKYYVHNDIFRYQDEVFHDVATDSEPDVAGEFLCQFSTEQCLVHSDEVHIFAGYRSDVSVFVADSTFVTSASRLLSNVVDR